MSEKVDIAVLQRIDNIFRLKKAYKSDLYLVFCRENGSPLPKSTLFNAFRRITRKGWLALSQHPYITSYACSVVIGIKCGDEIYPGGFGDGSMQITSDIYTHVSKKIETDSIEHFENHTKKIILGAELGHKSNG